MLCIMMKLIILAVEKLSVNTVDIKRPSLSKLLITTSESGRSPKNEVMYQLLSNVLIHKLYISRKLLHLIRCMMRTKAQWSWKTRCKRLTCYLPCDDFTWLRRNFFLASCCCRTFFALRKWVISDFGTECFLPLLVDEKLKSQHL